jgi:hypothetical protein
MLGPEDQAREKIDAALDKAGWKFKIINLAKGTATFSGNEAGEK